MRVVITGWRSFIASEFRKLTDDEAIWAKPCEVEQLPTAERYLFCHGLLRSKLLEDQTSEERAEGWMVNYHSVVDHCDWILRGNPHARICIIGSESAYRGSYDETYAVAKMAVHQYVERKDLKPGQQLVAISPSIIADAGMTKRRRDTGNLKRRLAEHPKRRFLLSKEVARMAHHLLYEQPYISGTVVRMHGGQK